METDILERGGVFISSIRCRYFGVFVGLTSMRIRYILTSKHIRTMHTLRLSYIRYYIHTFTPLLFYHIGNYAYNLPMFSIN